MQCSSSVDQYKMEKDACLIRVAVEESATGFMVHLVDMPGASTRGASLDIAMGKVIAEAISYQQWRGVCTENDRYDLQVMQSENTNAQIADGDTELLIATDKSVDAAAIAALMQLAIISATDFQHLYDAIPDPQFRDATKERMTFYGKVPANADEMLRHVDEVGEYYLRRLGLTVTMTDQALIANRQKCMELLHCQLPALCGKVFCHDYEYWTVAKVLRRFLWHDRIHARALYRFAVKTWGRDAICNPFVFIDHG